MSLREEWEAHAGSWIAWARAPDHDSYWRFHRDEFLRLVPPPGRHTLDVGCGEGRLTRELARLGHRITGVDVSPTLVRAARDAAPELEFVEADAAALPFGDATFDIAIAFMSLHDFDEMERALAETARVLEHGGVLCAAVVHPINSAGTFASREPDSPFVIAGSYIDRRRYVEDQERDGLTMRFVSDHRSFAEYVNPILDAGFALERVHELTVPREAVRSPAAERWLRIPLFLHLRAVKQ